MAQPTGSSPLLPKPESIRDAQPTWHALKNATVHVSPTQMLEGATVYIKDGRIDGVAPAGAGADADALTGSRVWDATGLHVYAGFIEPFLEVEAPAPDRAAPGVHQNPNVVPQRSALDGVGIDAETRKTLRGLGFTSAAISPMRGNFRGTAALVSVGDVPAETSADRPPVYRNGVYQAASIKSGEAGFRVYPSSQMGAIALVRQTLMDADHRAEQVKRGVWTDPWSCLDALADKSVPLAFDVEHELESLRAAKIGQEFGRPTILIGSGNEYKRLDPIAANGNATILPLKFAKTPQVDSLSKVDELDLRDLMAWEQAPTNPRRLDERGLIVALTSSELESRRDFPANLRKAINHGLKEDRALAMLTTNPAKMLGVESLMGTVEKGKVANLIVADGPIFAKKTKIRDVWVDGRRYEITPETPKGIAGTWDYTFGMGEERDGAIVVEVGDDGKVSVKSEEKPDGEGPEGGKKSGGEKARNVSYKNGVLSYVVDISEPDATSSIVVTATLIGDGMSGRILIPGIGTMPFTGARRADAPKTPAQKIAGTWLVTEADGKPVLPDAPDLPRAEITDKGEMTILVGDAKSVATDVVIEEGKISFAYENDPFGDAGIIKDTATIANDEMVGQSAMPDGTIHSDRRLRQAHHAGADRLPLAHGHQQGRQRIAVRRSPPNAHPGDTKTPTRSTGTASSPAGSRGQPPARLGQRHRRPELRQQDPLGRAAPPTTCTSRDAIPGIKFALGENVKQSNWGTATRYPQTRMGVETIIRDRFTAGPRVPAPPRPRGTSARRARPSGVTWSSRPWARSSRASASSTATATARTRS
jgi:hypothetical protein